MGGAYYEIVVKGTPRVSLVAWWTGLEIRAREGDTTELYGWVADQAALQGLISNIGDLGLELVSVCEVPGER